MNKTILYFIFGLLVLTSCQYDDTKEVKYKAWPKGKIPYIMVGFNFEEMNKISRCMMMWQMASMGKIKFFLSIDDKQDNILIIMKNPKISPVAGLTLIGCYPTSFLMLDENILKEEKYILHELGHIIGLPHEHQRPDVLLYFNIKVFNLLFITQFISFDEKMMMYDYKMFPYDKKSITHYPVPQKNEIFLIESKIENETIDNENISFIDSLKVQYIYRDSDHEKQKIF